MYVQDLKSSAINTTAEISEQEAHNFIDMCKAFTPATVHEKTIDEYMVYLSQTRSSGSALSFNGVSSMNKSSYELSEAPIHSFERFKNAIANSKGQFRGENVRSNSSCNVSSDVKPDVALNIASNVIPNAASNVTLNVTRNVASKVGSNAAANAYAISKPVIKLVDVINVDEVVNSSKNEMNRILTRSKIRIQNEQDIINMLSLLLTTYDSTIKIAPFGSSTYGFGGEKSHISILIITGSIHLYYTLN